MTPDTSTSMPLPAKYAASVTHSSFRRLKFTDGAGNVVGVDARSPSRRIAPLPRRAATRNFPIWRCTSWRSCAASAFSGLRTAGAFVGASFGMVPKGRRLVSKVPSPVDRSREQECWQPVGSSQSSQRARIQLGQPTGHRAGTFRPIARSFRRCTSRRVGAGNEQIDRGQRQYRPALPPRYNKYHHALRRRASVSGDGGRTVLPLRRSAASSMPSCYSPRGGE